MARGRNRASFCFARSSDCVTVSIPFSRRRLCISQCRILSGREASLILSMSHIGCMCEQPSQPASPLVRRVPQTIEKASRFFEISWDWLIAPWHLGFDSGPGRHGSVLCPHKPKNFAVGAALVPTVLLPKSLRTPPPQIRQTVALQPAGCDQYQVPICPSFRPRQCKTGFWSVRIWSPASTGPKLDPDARRY